MKPTDHPINHPIRVEERHFIAYWKWNDFKNREDDAAAYHSDAAIVATMGAGNTLWLLTRDPAHKRLHLVRVFRIARQRPEYLRPPWRFGVEGASLFDRATQDRWLERDWFQVFTQLVTLKGNSLQSRDAPHFCQRIMQPRELSQTSSDLLNQSASE